MRDVIDAGAHDHLHRAIARHAAATRSPGPDRSDVNGPAIVRAESRMSLAVHDAGPDGDEFQQVLVPFHALDGELDADDAVRAHGLGFGAHARHGEFARVVHRLREHIQFLVLAPASRTGCRRGRRRCRRTADRLEAGFAHEQEFIDAEIRREHAGRIVGRTRMPCRRSRACAGRSAVMDQMAPSSSFDA